MFHSIKKLALPFVAGAIALTTLSACDTSVSFRAGRTHDRIWYGDPYCRNSWDYGCRYDYNDGARIGIIFRGRHGGGWGGWGVMADADASRPSSWAKEFNLSSKAVRTLTGAFKDAIDGRTEKLAALGMTEHDVARLQSFSMPSSSSIAKAAARLHVKKSDLRDFVEVFTIRMKTSLAANE